MLLMSTRLGIIACSYLVECYYIDTWVSAPEIAERYNMNVRSLMPALRNMTRAGILKSRVGGKNPGFIFSKDPKNFTLWEIVNILEEKAVMECCVDIVPGLKCDCRDKTKCGIFKILGISIDEIHNRLSSITIADHARKQKLKEKE